MGRSYESLNRKVQRDEQGRRVVTHPTHAIKVEKCNAPGKYIVSVGSDTFVVRESRLKETVKIIETISKLPDDVRRDVQLLDSGNVLINRYGKQACVSNAGDIADAIKALEPAKPTAAELDPEPIVPFTPGTRQRQQQAAHDEWQARRDAEAAEKRQAARDEKLVKIIKGFVTSTSDNGAGEMLDADPEQRLEQHNRKWAAIKKRSQHLQAVALAAETDPNATDEQRHAARLAWVQSYGVTELADDEVARYLGETPADPGQSDAGSVQQ